MSNYSGIIAPYARFGGKSRLKKRLLSYFAPNYEGMTYIEPFFGGGSLFFYKKPSKTEVINDLDKNIYILMNGFKKYNGDEISASINGDYNKEDFFLLKDTKPTTAYEEFLRILIMMKISFFSEMRTFKYANRDQHVKSNYGTKYNERLKDTIILNKDYKEVIKKYDSPQSFFYLDPPYSMSEKKKYYDNQHININELYELLKNIKGKFLLSYDNSAEIKELFKEFNIIEIITIYSRTQNLENREKIELVIKNY